MRFGIFGLLAALAVGMITVTGDVSTADAQACRKNYYRCNLNRGGRIESRQSQLLLESRRGPPFHDLPEEILQVRLKRRWTS
jgi:hypothetical protein